MKYKMIAIDLDDTSLNDKGKLSSKDKKAMKRLEDAGIKVIFATGKSEFVTKKLVQEANLSHNRHVIINGASILDTNGKSKFISTIDKQVARDLLEKLRSENREILLYTKDGLKYENGKRLRVPVKFYHGKNNVTKGNLDEYIDETPRIVSYFGDKKELEYLRSICPKGLYTTAFPPIIDYMQEGINKFSGVKYLLDFYNIKPSELIAIGDQESDKQILEAAGLSFAVKNCDNFAREAASVVLPVTNNENTIDYITNNYILK